MKPVSGGPARRAALGPVPNASPSGRPANAGGSRRGPSAPTAKPHTPGQDAPPHLSGEDAAPANPKMSMSDKIQTAGNLAMAVSSIAPMVTPLFHGKEDGKGGATHQQAMADAKPSSHSTSHFESTIY